MHLLEREIVLNVDQMKLWDFMATPVNLNDLTPPELHFQIINEPPERMYNGLMMEYRIQIPLFGCWRWLAEIKHIREGEYFVDEQRQGPYRLWYHQHILEPASSNRTRMVDRVNYALPFNRLGALIHKYKVRKMLNEIFDYRLKKLQKIFNDHQD